MATHALGTINEDAQHLRQATIEMWHPGCWGLELTNRFSGAHIIEKSTYQTEDSIKADLVIVVEDASEMDELLDRATESDSVNSLTVLKNAGDRARVLAKYDKNHSVIPTITDSDLMAVEPFHLANGYKYWTVVVPSGTLSEQIEMLEEEFEVHIKSVRDFRDTDCVEYGDVVDRIYSELSPRQKEAMFLAAELGYYQWPRDVSAETIAEEMGVSGPTFLEHLRTGEHKLIRRLLDTFKQRHKNRLLPNK